jgi:DNA-binding response OmpR family regulator
VGWHVDDHVSVARHVLIADRDPAVASRLRTSLVRRGFGAVAVKSASAATELLSDNSFDVAVIDHGLDGGDGWDLLDCAVSSPSSVLMTAAQADPTLRSEGIERGADDFVSKPFFLREVVARVAALCRRSSSTAAVSFGDVVIDLDTDSVSVRGEPVHLARREFELLAYLARHHKRTVGRDEILREVWGSSAQWQDPATVTVHMGRLRRKLERDPSEPAHLLTVHRVGYRLRPGSEVVG